MKFLVCAACRHIIALNREEQTCPCGEVRGKYRTNGLDADVQGDGVLVGVHSADLVRAIDARNGDDYQVPIRAWVIPPDAPSVRWKDHPTVIRRVPARPRP